MRKEIDQLRVAIKELENVVWEAFRWRSWKDEPPEADQDCLLMEGGGQVYRSNLPQHEDNEFLEWWRPFGPEPEDPT